MIRSREGSPHDKAGGRYAGARCNRHRHVAYAWHRAHRRPAQLAHRFGGPIHAVDVRLTLPAEAELFEPYQGERELRGIDDCEPVLEIAVSHRDDAEVSAGCTGQVQSAPGDHRHLREQAVSATRLPAQA